jgi:hypothetical protein
MAKLIFTAVVEVPEDFNLNSIEEGEATEEVRNFISNPGHDFFGGSFRLVVEPQES